MGLPQIIMIGLCFANLAIYAVKHGEKREGEYNFWVGLISTAIEIFILYKGGFFKQ